MRSSIKTFVAALLFCGFTVAAARAENALKEPTVGVLSNLLGHKIEDETVQNFVKAQHLQKYAKGDSGGYDRPNDPTESFALLFRGNVISRVIVYVVPIKGGVSAYGGTLPFGVKATDSPQMIRHRFGKARYDIVGKRPNKPGDGWLVYHLGEGVGAVTFSFTHNKMDEIDLDTPGRL